MRELWNGSTTGVDELVLGEATLTRSLNADSDVVLSSTRMTYFDDDVESRLAMAAVLIDSEVTRGYFGWFPERVGFCG